MAARFWVLGTGTWDASDTTHWSATSGGSGGASVPGSGDTVTFDANSGGGTVTLNFGGTITIQSLTMGAFTGTWDNSVNNNNVTITNSGTAFNISGSGTRTLKFGTATYTLSGTNATMTSATVTNLTFTGNTGCTIAFTGTGARTFTSGSISHGNITVGAASSGGSFTINGSSTMTLNGLSISPTNYIVIASGITVTISTAFTWTGTSSNQIAVVAGTPGSSASIAAAASSTAAWTAFYMVTFTGSPTASNSFDLGGNGGITITAPSVGGGGTTVGVIG